MKFALKITTKSAVFYRLLLGKVCPENSREIGQFFRKFVPKNPAEFGFFSSATYQKPCIEHKHISPFPAVSSRMPDGCDMNLL